MQAAAMSQREGREIYVYALQSTEAESRSRGAQEWNLRASGQAVPDSPRLNLADMIGAR